MADILLCETLGINVCESKGNENNATSVLLCNQGRVLLPQSITLCRFVPLVWETSSQQLKCQLLVTGFHLSFEIKNSVVQKMKHCNDVTVLQPCTLP